MAVDSSLSHVLTLETQTLKLEQVLDLGPP